MTEGACVYLLHGMKRSGNHAIINWLLPQVGARLVNNAIPLAALIRGNTLPQPVPLAEWCEARPELRGVDVERLLVTLEDHELTTMPIHTSGVPMRRLLVIRDPWQVFSSRIRKAFLVEMPAYPRRNDTVMQRAVRIWKQHARCFLGTEPVYGDRIAILFDEWVRNCSYRQSLSRALGLPFDDRGFGRVSGEGGGSSFDGVRFDGQGYEMDLSNRVAKLDSRERDLLEEIFMDEELVQIGQLVRAADPFRQILR